MDIAKIILNPARLRILQYISLHKQATAANMVKVITDIPRATIYKHVKLLEESNFITVVEENRVRGAVEKVYAVSPNSALTDKDNARLVTSAMCMNMLQEINHYFDTGDGNFKRDKVIFSEGLLSVTDGEYEDFLKELNSLFSKYLNLPKTPDRHIRKLYLACMPPEIEKKGDNEHDKEFK